MDIIDSTAALGYKTLQVRFDEDIAFVRIYRPQANNTINNELIEEFGHVLRHCESTAKIVVIEGLPHVFCFGADFKEIEVSLNSGGEKLPEQNPAALYDIWLKLSEGSFLTIAHVQGKANAGGIGFVAACDIVLSDDKAIFSLSELLFGLMPACVMPFLIRRVGFSKAHYMTLMTQPVSVQQAHDWGLVDAFESNSESLVRKHLVRLRRLSKTGIKRYKRYVTGLDDYLKNSRAGALNANVEVFSDRENLEKIARYVKTGQFPWEN